MTEKRTRPEQIPDTGTVTVCCNIPNGLLLHLYDFEKDYEPVLGGGQREIKRAVRRTETPVVIFGPKRDVKIEYLIVGNYALTPNVDAAFFSEWLEQNKNSPLVKNGCIYALADEASARDWAKENEARKSGLEPLDMSSAVPDARVPRSIKTDTAKAA